MNTEKKYLITKSILIYTLGRKDILENQIETDNLEIERERIKKEFDCVTVYFTFTEKSNVVLINADALNS